MPSSHSKTTTTTTTTTTWDDGIDIPKSMMMPMEEEEEGGHDEAKALTGMQSDNGPGTTKQHQKDMMPNNYFDPPFQVVGSRTKFFKRQKNHTDKRNNNARVRKSYLKLVLEDAVLDHLSNATGQLKRQWEARKSLIVEKGNGQQSIQPTNIIRSKKQSHRQSVTILPRSRSSLHMTYFFVGKVLDCMTSEDVQRWHTAVKECVTTMDYYYLSDGGGDDDNKRDHSLHFKSLTLFPPGKDNLLVATFDPSIALEKLYEKLCHLAVSEKKMLKTTTTTTTTTTSNNYLIDDNITTTTTSTPTTLEMNESYEFPLLRDLILQQQKKRKQCTSSSMPTWFAHVTLASIVGGTKDERNTFREWLNGMIPPRDKVITVDADNENGAFARDSIIVAETMIPALLSGTSINALGVELGGPIPDALLDWNFPFRDAMVDTTDSN